MGAPAITLRDLPPLPGLARERVALAPLTWMRVGGPADLLVNVADADALAAWRRELGPVPLLPMGVASNLLVRDSGFRGVVVRFGGALARVEVEEGTVIAGAGALDLRVAQTALRAGLSGLEFFVGIPGTIGGAVRMNAGAFGGEAADALLWAEVMDAAGRVERLKPCEIGFSYRHSGLGPDAIVLRAAFRATPGDAGRIKARMEAIKAEREASQPVRVATGGSTFKNPPGEKAWRLIDEAGCRGLRLGRASVSAKHCNFLINEGGASAAELEGLGEEVRRRVRERSGLGLSWEVARVGEALPLAANARFVQPAGAAA